MRDVSRRPLGSRLRFPALRLEPFLHRRATAPAPPEKRHGKDEQQNRRGTAEEALRAICRGRGRLPGASGLRGLGHGCDPFLPWSMQPRRAHPDRSPFYGRLTRLPRRLARGSDGILYILWICPFSLSPPCDLPSPAANARAASMT